jgi:hypothetical protein
MKFDYFIFIGSIHRDYTVNLNISYKNIFYKKYIKIKKKIINITTII